MLDSSYYNLNEKNFLNETKRSYTIYFMITNLICVIYLKPFHWCGRNFLQLMQKKIIDIMYLLHKQYN